MKDEENEKLELSAAGQIARIMVVLETGSSYLNGLQN